MKISMSEAIKLDMLIFFDKEFSRCALCLYSQRFWIIDSVK